MLRPREKAVQQLLENFLNSLMLLNHEFIENEVVFYMAITARGSLYLHKTSGPILITMHLLHQGRVTVQYGASEKYVRATLLQTGQPVEYTSWGYVICSGQEVVHGNCVCLQKI